MKNQKVVVMAEIAIFAAIALVLDLFIPSLSHAVKISFKMLPIMILALRRGLVPGLVSGFLWGLMQILVGEATIVSFSQALIEYLFAFTAVGVAGLLFAPLQKQLAKEKINLVQVGLFSGLGVILGSLSRYFFHFLAGFLFWGQYAPESQSPVLYSFLVNGSAFLTETLTCLVVMILLVPFSKTLLKPKA